MSSTDLPAHTLIDVGANLAHDSFDHDREQVLTRARDAGVASIVITGSCASSSRAALELARTRPGQLFGTAGVHPHHAKDWTAEDRGWMRTLAANPEVVAIGECGLDFCRNFSSPEDQELAFRAQLEIAIETALPVFLHQRDAHERFCVILGDYLDHLSRAVAHCFTGSQQELDDYLDMGLYIGITGWICDERRGHHLRDLIPAIPQDRLLLETDSPYLLPRDLDPKPSGRRNEPMYLPHVAETVAGCSGETLEEIAERTSGNARRFFSID